MAFLDSWRIGFELELLLGDLDEDRFHGYLEDPMDTASRSFCRTVARQLTEFTGRRWQAAHKKQRRTGYFVYPEYDLDPINWPFGLVAGVELVTPPLPMAEAEDLRQQIRGWVDSVDGDINTYPNQHSANSGWHINIDTGCSYRPIRLTNMLVAADELPVLISSQRYPSKYASPQRHAYGVPLLRYVRSKDTRGLLDIEVDNFLYHYGGRGKRYAMNLDKLEQDYLELRHFGAENFFREQTLQEIVAPFIVAAEATHDELHIGERRLLSTFELLAEWTDQIAPALRCVWLRSTMATNWAFGELYFENEVLADVSWSGAAIYSIRVSGDREGPTISGQAFPDLALSIAVLALDLAEIRLRKLDRIVVTNKAFSKEIDRLAQSLKNSGFWGGQK